METINPQGPVRLPIEDVLDLHTFQPKDVPELLPSYLEACRAKQIYCVRIIHGKGTGKMKKRVQKCLAENPHVVSWREADLSAGGWGATIVRLRSSEKI